MTIVDLHPEPLFDALRDGSLSADDRVRLEAHCDQCAACRFELRWLDDGMGADSPTARDRAYAEAALDNVLRVGKRAPAPRKWLTWRTRGALLVAGLGVGLMLGPTLGSRQTHTGLRAAPAPSVPAPNQTEPEAEPLEPPAPDHAERARPVTPPAASANALLAAARRASTQRQFKRAAGLYRHVIEDFATTPAAAASLVALGRLLGAELAQPRAAVAQFDGYLKRYPRGELAEEALYYRAEALQRLGRATQARTSLRELVSTFPHSLYVQPARARLGEEIRE
jgi:tetratricopeptide (TPR) repeat protein